MNCPRCVVELRIGHRQGVEIDLCPRCRGTWLDRGELDKILERANATQFYIDEEDDDDLGPRHAGDSIDRRLLPRAGERRASFGCDPFDHD